MTRDQLARLRSSPSRRSNLRTIPQRLGSSAVAVVGSPAWWSCSWPCCRSREGFSAAMRGAGLARPRARHAQRRRQRDDERPERAGDRHHQAGARHPPRRAGPLASAELFVMIDLPKKSTGTPPTCRCAASSRPPAVREEVEIVEGRMLQFGTNEVDRRPAARAAVRRPDVGYEIKSGQTVEGGRHLRARRQRRRNRIVVRRPLLQGAYRRGNSYQSVLARLDSPESFDAFKDWLTSNPQLNVSGAAREPSTTRRNRTTLTRLIRAVGFGIASLMGIGAVFGAILTMYTAVSTRTREIATLRALGFNTRRCSSRSSPSRWRWPRRRRHRRAGAYSAFNGYQTSTMNWQTFSQVAFAFAVTPGLLAQGLVTRSSWASSADCFRRSGPPGCRSLRRCASLNLIGPRTTVARTRPPVRFGMSDVLEVQGAA